MKPTTILTEQKPARTTENTTAPTRLPRWERIIYGSGDWGRASFNTLRQIFYAIFLTDTVGLDPRLASFAALIGILWDAVNDPLVGALSDNVRTRWGRRRPFMLVFSVPFALAFVVLLWAPPWDKQWLLMIHCTLAFMMADTIQTLVTVPYLALTPELAPDYDDRTSLTTIRMFFNLLASLTTAVAAPMILDAALKMGFDLQRGYLVIAALFGGLATIPYLLIFAFIRERPIAQEVPPESLTFRQTFKLLWQNTPFKFATGIYVLNWIAFDIVALMLPYFLLYWLAQGDLLMKVAIFGAKISLESVVLGVLLITATLALPLWNWMARRFNKRSAYIYGMSFWIVVQLTLLTVQPKQIGYLIFLAFLAGLSVSTAHVMPESIFPDVIDWDELVTHTRREGMYYGAVNLMRKLSSALAIFIALQLLGWFGYQAPPVGVEQFNQSARTLDAIRFLTGPMVGILLICAIVIAWFYPLSRERQIRIRRILERRQHKNAYQARFDGKKETG